MLNPSLILLDEIDSGLDVDALKSVCKGINKQLRPDRSLLIITHYPRILKYLKPDYVHVLVKGKLVKSGDIKLAHQIEKKGYGEFG